MFETPDGIRIGVVADTLSQRSFLVVEGTRVSAETARGSLRGRS